MKRIRLERWGATGLLLALLAGWFRPFPAAGNAGAAGITVLKTSDTSLTLQVSVPDYQLAAENLEGRTFQRLTVDGAGRTAEAGYPEVPVFTALLGVPPRGEVKVEIQEAGPVRRLGKLALPAAPHPAPPAEEMRPGEMSYAAGPAYPVVRQGTYPRTLARAAEVAWLRDQRTVRLEVFPFQVDLASGEVTLRQNLTIQVYFLGSQSSTTSAVETPPDDPLYEPVYRQALLNYTQARAWRGQAEPDQIQEASPGPSIPAGGAPRYRIAIDHDGLYRISAATLQAAGLDLAQLDPCNLHLTSQGDEIAYFLENQDGDPARLGAGEGLIFFGQKFKGERMAAKYTGEDDLWISFSTQDAGGNYITWQPHMVAGMFEKYTDTNVYWLSVGSGPGTAMLQVDGAPQSGTPTASSFRETVHAEQSHFRRGTQFNGEDNWFWDELKFTAPVNRSYPVDLPDPVAGPEQAILRLEMTAESEGSGTPDHQVRVYLNDPARSTLLAEKTWDGKSRAQFQANVDPARLLNGVNSLDLVGLLPAGRTSDQLYFNWLEVEYDRLLRAVGNQLIFGASEAGTWKFPVDGFSTRPTAILDVTDPLRPAWIENAEVATTQLAFQSTVAEPRRYAAGVPEEIQAGDLQAYTAPDFSHPAGYLVITHHDLLAAAQTLADYRASQGLTSRVIDIQDLYNCFTDGIYSPLAIKNFLAYAFSQWSARPAYVLLLGDGHWNFKNYVSWGSSSYDGGQIFIPPLLSWVDPWQGEVDSANLLATVSGSDPLPDVLIARAPVRSVAEAASFVSKTIGYEAAPYQAWQRNHLFAADNVPDAAGDFQAFAEKIIQDYAWTGFSPVKIYENDFACTSGSLCPAATQGLINALNGPGAALVNYIGHGSVSSWSGENLFTRQNIASLSNGGRLPVVLSWTCLDGYWSYPGNESLIEELVRAENKGAVAAFSPTGLGVSTGHDLLQRGFYDSLYTNDEWALGQAALTAKLLLYQAGYARDLLETFTVFGDPALQINRTHPFAAFLPVAVH